MPEKRCDNLHTCKLFERSSFFSYLVIISSLFVGTFDLFPCVGAPLIASQPHFYGADPVLLRDIETGLNPVKENHEIYMHFEVVRKRKPIWIYLVIRSGLEIWYCDFLLVSAKIAVFDPYLF